MILNGIFLIITYDYNYIYIIIMIVYLLLSLRELEVLTQEDIQTHCTLSEKSPDTTKMLQNSISKSHSIL